MRRIVVEKVEPLHVGVRRERHHFIDASVPPADVRPVFLRIVLRIKNEDIRIADKLDDIGIHRGRHVIPSP